MKSVTLLAADTTAANDQLHMQYEEKNIFWKVIYNLKQQNFRISGFECWLHL